MKITIRRTAIAYDLPKKAEIEVPDGLTVRGLISHLALVYGSSVESDLINNDALTEGALIFLNGESLYQLPREVHTSVKEGDNLYFTVMVFGG